VGEGGWGEVQGTLASMGETLVFIIAVRVRGLDCFRMEFLFLTQRALSVAGLGGVGGGAVLIGIGVELSLGGGDCGAVVVAFSSDEYKEANDAEQRCCGSDESCDLMRLLLLEMMGAVLSSIVGGHGRGSGR